MNQTKWKQTTIETLVFILCLFMGLILFSFYSPDLGGDSQFYLSNGHEILKNGLRYYAKHFSTPYYWGYPTFVALLMLLVGENYTVIVCTQIVLSALSSAFLYRMLMNGSNEKRICVVAIALTIFYRGIQDVWLWDRMILSDSLGLTLEIMTIYSFWKIKKDRKRTDYLLFFAMSLLFFITRTNSIVLILVLIAFLIADLPKTSRIVVTASLLICGVGILCGLFALGEGEMHGLGRRVDYYSDLFKRGIVIFDRPQYDVAVTCDSGTLRLLTGCITVFLKREVFFWNIYLKDYSLLHKIYNAVALLPLFAGSVVSGVYLMKKRIRCAYPYIVGVLAYNIVQAFTEIDYDMRYRIPIFVLLIIINMIAIRTYCSTDHGEKTLS